MTLSTSLTLGGFLQGPQGEWMALIGALVFVLVVWIVIHRTISQFNTKEMVEDVATARRWTNRIAGIVVLLLLVGFVVNAATYATNAVPHSDLDKTSIYEQMHSNTQQ